LGLGLPEETAKRLADECREFLRRQLPKKVRFVWKLVFFFFLNPGFSPRPRVRARR
jgi:hypothetical protein